MTAPEIIQIIAAVGTLLGILVNAILTLRNGWKTDIVAAHVNSAATKAQEEISSLRKQVESMQRDSFDKQQIAALLAAKSGPAPTSDPQPVEIVNPPTNPVPVVTAKPK